jgi:HPt (histidine-containing phosphotransfer) domain-containing protein
MSGDRTIIDTRDLLDACGTGDPSNLDVLREILGHVIRQNAKRMELARAALATDQRGELAQVAHAVKGSAALVGAHHLVDIARRLEQDAGTASPEALAAAVAAMQAEFTAVIHALHGRHPDAVDTADLPLA